VKQEVPRPTGLSILTLPFLCPQIHYPYIFVIITTIRIVGELIIPPNDGFTQMGLLSVEISTRYQTET